MSLSLIESVFITLHKMANRAKWRGVANAFKASYEHTHLAYYPDITAPGTIGTMYRRSLYIRAN